MSVFSVCCVAVWREAAVACQAATTLRENFLCSHDSPRASDTRISTPAPQIDLYIHIFVRLKLYRRLSAYMCIYIYLNYPQVYKEITGYIWIYTDIYPDIYPTTKNTRISDYKKHLQRGMNTRLHTSTWHERNSEDVIQENPLLCRSLSSTKPEASLPNQASPSPMSKRKQLQVCCSITYLASSILQG